MIQINYENEEIQETIQNVEKRKKGKEAVLVSNDLKSKKLQMELVHMNQLCSKLVSSQEAQEPILTSEMSKNVEIIGEQNIFRCKVWNCASPVCIKIDYSRNLDPTNLDLTIFSSIHNKRPDFKDHQRKFLNRPKQLVIHAKGRDGQKESHF